MNTISLVDKYISLKKQADDLETQIEQAAMDLKLLGLGEHRGTRGVVKIGEAAGRKTTDWKLVQTFVRIPEDVLAKCTKTGAVSYRITIGAL